METGANAMNPQGEIKQMAEFMEEHQKSSKELVDEGFVELNEEEHQSIQSLSEDKRMDALKNIRFNAVRKAAFDAQAYERKQSIKKKKNKNRKKMINASRKKNRRNRRK